MGNKFLFAVIMAFTNHLGIPAFMQGRKKTGLVRLALTFVTFGICGFINGILGLLLGIRILRMSSDEFEDEKYTLDTGIPSARMLGEANDEDFDDEPSSAPKASAKKSDSFNVLLNSTGFDETGVLQAIVQLKDCSLEDAVKVVESGIVFQDVSEDVADRAMEILKKAGATVEKEEAYDYDEFSSENMLDGSDDEDYEDSGELTLE